MPFLNIYGTFKFTVESREIVMMMKTCYLMENVKMETLKKMRFNVLAKVRATRTQSSKRSHTKLRRQGPLCCH